ncbi:MAG TPA: hypothetical protein PLF40_21975 [Kofleriaceae bacterium]|nr:hypothetical protein [Kofleriaceae bacterium]
MIFDFLIIGLVFGGILAVANGLLSRGLNGQQAIANLLPLNVAIGVFLIVMGVINLLRNLEDLSGRIGYRPVASAIFYGGIFVALLMGGFFAVSLLARWVPANSPAEQKMKEIVEKLTPVQAMFGLVAMLLAFLLLLQRTGTLTINT